MTSTSATPFTALTRLALGTIIACAAVSLPAPMQGQFVWDDDCMPFNGWASTCNDGNDTNWTDDNIPGPGDAVVIGASFGQTLIDQDMEVLSATVPGGLLCDGGEVLTLNASSTITDLVTVAPSAGLRAKAGVTVTLDGQPDLGGDLYGPGSFLLTGDSDISGLDVFDAATIENFAAATHASGILWLGSSIFDNFGTLSISNDVEGSNARLVNQGSMTIASSIFDPELVSHGNFDVVGGIVEIRSRTVEFLGGAFTMSNGAELFFSSPFGGPYSRLISVPSITGAGTLSITRDFTIASNLSISLALSEGSPGAFVVDDNATITLDANLSNLGDLVLAHGTLEGPGEFSNFGRSGCQEDGGGGVLGVDTVNLGTFIAWGCNLILDGSTFSNLGRFLVTSGGGILGNGTLVNSDRLDIQSSSSTTSRMTAGLDNDGTLKTGGGVALEGPVDNLVAGVLTGGTWVVHAGALDFPGSAIFELRGAEIELISGGRIPDLELSLLRMGRSPAGRPARLRLPNGHDFRTAAQLLLADDSAVEVEEGASLEASTAIDLGEDGSVIPELSGVVVLGGAAPAQTSPSAEGATAPPTVITDTFNNYGRVLPMQRFSGGTLQLDGDYVQHGVGRLAVEVGTGGVDLLAVDGDAFLDGKIEIDQLGSLTPGDEFTVLTATGAVTGQFAEIVSSHAFTVIYDAQAVSVRLDATGDAIFADGFEAGDLRAWGSVPSPGNIVINEIMQNPSMVSDVDGEWFEVHNTGSIGVDLNGWMLTDDDTDFHLIDSSGPLVVPPGGYLVFGRNGNTATNGAVAVDYVYDGMNLGNAADELEIRDLGLSLIDRVAWDDGLTFPDPNGASMTLADPLLDNSDGSNWCVASSTYGDGDLGTPGETNDTCP